MTVRPLTRTEIHRLANLGWLVPDKEDDFRAALAARDFRRALDCCRENRVEDLLYGGVDVAAPPQVTGYSPRWSLFAELTDFLTDDEYFPLLGDAWVEFDDKRVPPEAVEPIFRPANRDATKRWLVMNVQESHEFGALPATFDVFRGCTRDTADNCSWSLDFTKAKHFATTFAGSIEDSLCSADQTPVVFRIPCTKADVLAVFTRWGEKEIVVRPSRLRDKVEVWPPHSP